MSATLRIAGMYRRPRTIVRSILDEGTREDRALIFLVLGRKKELRCMTL